MPYLISVRVLSSTHILNLILPHDFQLQKDLKTIKILKKQLDSSITEGKVNEELMEYLFKTIHELNKYIAKVGEIL